MALDEKYFRSLTNSLGEEWEALATELDFRKSEVYKFKQDNVGNVSNQMFAMLVAWKQRQGNIGVAAAETLINALRKLNRNDLADSLQERVNASQRPADSVDLPNAGVHIAANIITPEQQATNQQKPEPSHQQKPEPSHQQAHGNTRTTYTYDAPAGSVPYVGRLTITGQNSPVIIGSVQNSTFNFSSGGKRK